MENNTEKRDFKTGFGYETTTRIFQGSCRAILRGKPTQTIVTDRFGELEQDHFEIYGRFFAENRARNCAKSDNIY